MADKGTKEPQDERSKRQAYLESLSPQQLEAVRAYAWDKLLRSRKVKVNGKQISLRALAEDVRKKTEEYDRGVYDEDVRTIPRWQSQEMVPSNRLRPGSQKQILRPEEEDNLELQRIGHGNSFRTQNGILGFPLPWQRNFAYGIFARPERVKAVLGPAWAGRDPEAVLEDPTFFNDILRRCNQVEMTLMLLTSRPLKIQEVKPVVENALRSSMERLSGSQPLRKEAATALTNFIHQIDERRFKNTGFVKDGNILEGTHFILGADPKGGLIAEAIIPGTLSQRRTSFIGTAQNPLLTAAVFDAFLGPNAVDPVGKRQTGRGMLWAANGLSFEPIKQGNITVGVADENGDLDLSREGEEERLIPSTSLFQLRLGREKPSPMFLNKIALGGA